MTAFELASALFLAVLCGHIAWRDWQSFRIGDGANLLLLAGGVVQAMAGRLASGLEPGAALLATGFDVLVCGLSFLLLRNLYRALTGRHGLGLGDVKFAAAAGAWTALAGFPWMVMIASLLALAYVGATALAEGHWPSGRRVPFGTFLAPSLFVTWAARHFFSG
jgi:leader peptidase (prepilin peptidase)/N-methyltransferase